MIFSNENRTCPSLCGWIWQLDCVSLGHWPQGTTPGILSCWHRFSYTAMPTVLWSFTTGCTSEQCKAKSRECERVSLGVLCVLSSYSWIVQCCVCVSSRPVTCLMTVPVSACQRINLPDNSQLTAFSPPFSFPIIPEYISEGNIFSTRTPCEVKFSTHPQIGTKDSYFLVGNLCSAPCIKCLQTCGRFWNMREIVTNCLPTATCQKACCTRSRSQRPFPAPCLQPVLVTWGSCQ